MRDINVYIWLASVLYSKSILKQQGSDNAFSGIECISVFNVGLNGFALELNRYSNQHNEECNW